MYIILGKQRRGIGFIFPPDWINQGERSRLAFAAFEVAPPSREPFAEPLRLHHGNALVYLYEGALEYPPKIVVKTFPNQAEGSLRNHITPVMKIMLCFLKKIDPEKSDYELEHEVNSIAILTSLKLGQNCLIKCIVTSSTDFTQLNNTEFKVTRRVTGYPLDFELSGTFLDISRLREVTALIDKIGSHPKKHRIIQCTNWYLRSLNLENVDSFIAKWIALETLCMQNSSNIAPIKDTLAMAYSKSTDEIQQDFGIGQAYRIRSKIVHNGHRVELDFRFLTFMNYIIEDCLNQVAEEAPKRLTEKFLVKYNFDLVKYLSSLQTYML